MTTWNHCEMLRFNVKLQSYRLLAIMPQRNSLIVPHSGQIMSKQLLFITSFSLRVWTFPWIGCISDNCSPLLPSDLRGLSMHIFPDGCYDALTSLGHSVPETLASQFVCSCHLIAWVLCRRVPICWSERKSCWGHLNSAGGQCSPGNSAFIKN